MACTCCWGRIGEAVENPNSVADREAVKFKWGMIGMVAGAIICIAFIAVGMKGLNAAPGTNPPWLTRTVCNVFVGIGFGMSVLALAIQVKRAACCCHNTHWC